MESSNVIAAAYHHYVQRGADYEIGIQAKDADQQDIDWTSVQRVQADVKNSVGTVVASFILGDGLAIDDGDPTILYFRKTAGEKNIPAGTYDWDLLVQFTDDVAQYPLRGKYISVNYITA